MEGRLSLGAAALILQTQPSVVAELFEVGRVKGRRQGGKLKFRPGDVVKLMRA